MAPCKHWMRLGKDDRLNNEYKRGICEFLDYAFKLTSSGEKIKCPCTKCKNSKFASCEFVKDHLETFGILPGYTFWYHHGERAEEPQSNCVVCDVYDSDSEHDEEQHNGCLENTHSILRDLFPNLSSPFENESNQPHIPSTSSTSQKEAPNETASKFYRLFEDFQLPLFEGSKTSKLSAIVNLLHIKTLGKWSNESFTMLLQLLKTQLLPNDSTLPDSYYGAKKTIKDLGLSYEKIDVCVNDCMLFWKESGNLDYCTVCQNSRWEQDKHGKTRMKRNGKRIARKVLRYFPLKPRLQRLFMCSKTASHMTWHHDKRTKDNDVLRHPADAKAWVHFDKKHEIFSSEPRNVRLGLISDGFQPFSFSTTHSIWPVMLIPYNLPPSVCMKQSSIMLSMLIPGPQGPGDAIDVYLRPLVEELKELWEVGVETYDASKGENFRLHAALMSTINDFPAYGILSGYSTKGKRACPSCHKKTHSKWLHNFSKHAYMRHRRFLPIRHSLRKKLDVFGNTEPDPAPKSLSGEEILEQVKDLEGRCLSKDLKKRGRISHELRGDNWNKLSIFFELPYWKTHLLRHNLDVMHIEKNVCDIILKAIMNTKGKGKKKEKKATVTVGRKKKVAVRKGKMKKSNTKSKLSPESYILSKDQKHTFCQFLKDLKVPDGFSSNISRCVNMKELKISGLKSHDCHVLFENFLPLVIRGLLVEEVCEPLIELSIFFKMLCAKRPRISDLKKLKRQIPVTLSKLETVLPPSCFHVMLHLPIHLADEAILGGPVYNRWMYPGEQTLHTFNSYVGNKAHPEASIAEGFIASECMNLCSRYFDSIQTQFNRVQRNCDDNHGPCKDISIFSRSGKPLGAEKISDITSIEREQAHIYVLKNCKEVEPYYREYNETLGHDGIVVSQQQKDTYFVQWFKERIHKLHEGNKCPYGEEFLSLSRGPIQYVKSFSCYLSKGFRFHTSERERGLKTQNSGVVVVGDMGDGHGNRDFYGVLTDVIRLEYLGGNYIDLFHCDWFDVLDYRKGIAVDKYGFTSVNTKRFLKTDEAFVLASQVSQVFYVSDVVKKGSWRVVVKSPSLETDDLTTEDDDDLQNQETVNFAASTSTYSDDEMNNEDMGIDLEPEIPNVSSFARKRKRNC